MTLPVNTPSSSDIDYSTDTTQSDPNIHSDLIIQNSDIDIKMKKLYRKVGRHPTINSKFESSSESLKKYMDMKSFDGINKNNTTVFYSLDKLETIDFNFIYNIIVQSTYIIFVDNNMLVKNITPSCFNIFKKKLPHLTDTEFPGCTFFPFEAVNIIKKNLNKLNNSIFNAEVSGNTLYMNETVCYSVMFNEGEIIKNTLYKKMEIIDVIMFVPITIYNLKQIEYKLRGFCQIVEELGASSIDITFKTINNSTTKKEISTKIGDDIKLIAGNLGMTTNENKTMEMNYDYNLTYPKNSTITLNEKMIKNKIKKKKFIVSDSMYNSNLELQYLVHSRCRHLINMYSTIFTFDNTNVIDKNMYMKLKTHGIEISTDYKTLTDIKNNIEIITNVTFVTLEQCKDLINGNNVSLDEIGFSHIMETIKDEPEEVFIKNGIYKIMSFINMYISHNIKYNQPSLYKEIKKINSKIKTQLTMLEYAELLCNYFNMKSQWIHFTNYIDLLGRKAHSFDKIGYIVIHNNMNVRDRIEPMLQFIQQLCVEKKIEDNFWKMLQPQNMNLRNDLENKLLNEYDFVKNYNYYNLKMMIYRIGCYTTNYNNDNNIKLNELLTNMDVGYTHWEYYNNMLPFIITFIKSLYYDTKDEIYLNHAFEKSFNIDNFMAAKITNMNDMTQYIDKKFQRFKAAYMWINEISFPINVNDFIKEIEKNNYILKRMMYIIKHKSPQQIKKYLHKTCDLIEKDDAYTFVNMLFIYNDKLDIRRLPYNYIGFEMVMNNYNNGINEDELNKSVLEFIASHFINITKQMKDSITLDIFTNNCTTYQETLNYVQRILNESDV